MKIGFACLTVDVLNANYKTCILKNATEEKLYLLIENNLISLENVIDYNIKNDIKLFRISSDIIPFGSSPINKLKWDILFEERLNRIGKKINDSGIRVSMHPGQYTVLNSPREEVVTRAIDDLKYHTLFLNSLGTSTKSKIVLHIGGVYGDKEIAINRFIENYNLLDLSIKERLVIENDDKSYNINDVILISKKTKIPVVYDNLHNKINCYDETKKDLYWLELCSKSWQLQDGCQKMHYSQQDPNKQRGSHSATIDVSEFMELYQSIKNLDIDIMLEVKDKNISAINCINEINKNKRGV